MSRVVSKISGREIVPGIDIYADGRCLIRRFDGTEPEKRVSPSEVSELLRFLDQSGFFGLSNFLIDSKVDAAQRLPGAGIKGVTDDYYTFICARTTSKTNDIERYAIDFELEWYPEIAELKVMRDAFRRIHEVVGETRWLPPNVIATPLGFAGSPALTLAQVESLRTRLSKQEFRETSDLKVALPHLCLMPVYHALLSPVDANGRARPYTETISVCRLTEDQDLVVVEDNRSGKNIIRNWFIRDLPIHR